MTDDLKEALKSIDVATLSYEEWLEVGFALKAEGEDVSVWDEWSRADVRYKPGECERKWQSFGGSDRPVTAATIFKMAMNRGYVGGNRENEALDWDDVIEYDGNGTIYETTIKDTPAEQLIKYIRTLFRDDEHVGYVTSDVWKDDKGKWVPSKGVYDRTAKQLVEALEKYKDDIGAALGDWKPECGAWIRFNPVDGQGVKNENVTRFGYALVESDELPISEQDAIYRKLELPIACLVNSGGKSLHAIVRIDAADYPEYRKRVEFLYDFLADNGLNVDRANRNPSRLSRMPGVTRGGQMQTLVDANIGRKSWLDWENFARNGGDELGDIVYLSDMKEAPPLAPEVICGVLRQGHKLLLAGPSKAGKSFFLMELGISISEGRTYLGHKCNKAKVLYVNLEIDSASCQNRILNIYDKFGIPQWKRTKDNFAVWNLRGHAMPLDKLVPIMLEMIKGRNFKVIIIDPIYKVLTGDENSASDMAFFCNQFDRICNATGCSVIYAHHHAKGLPGSKSAMDRPSGSGVFARDPDALINISELEVNDRVRKAAGADPADTAWLIEYVVRDFESPQPQKIWFKYPLHEPDTTGSLRHSFVVGDPRNNLKQYRDGTAKSKEEKEEDLEQAFGIVSMGTNSAKVADLAKYMADNPESEEEVAAKRRSIYRLLKTSRKFRLEDGRVTLINSNNRYDKAGN